MFSILQKAILFFLSNQAFFRSALLWISLWKLWITICRKALLKNLCELVEQSREGRERAGKSREKEGKVQVFPIFDEARRAPFWVAGAVCGA